MKIVAIALFLLLVGCAKEPTAPQEPFNLDPHHITQEQALKTMNAMIGQLYSGTRAVRGYTIQTLKGRDLQKAGTRFDDDAPIFPEDVLYIVNFDDDEGFAVLAADDHYEPVIAITEMGHLSLSDLRLIEETDSTELTQEEFIGSIIMQAIVNQTTDPLEKYDPISHGGLLDGGFGGTGGGTGDTSTGGPIIVSGDPPPPPVTSVAPLLKTKWDQCYPFNAMCPIKTGGNWSNYGRAPVGCSVIAAAQIMAYHKFPALNPLSKVDISLAQELIMLMFGHPTLENYDEVARITTILNSDLASKLRKVNIFCDTITLSNLELELVQKIIDGGTIVDLGTHPIATTIGIQPTSYTKIQITWNDIIKYNYDIGTNFIIGGEEVENRYNTLMSKNIAYLMRWVGTGVDVTYHADGSATWVWDIDNFFRNIGYSASNFHWGFNDIINIVLNHLKEGRPVIVSADEPNWKGHSWVVDGYKYLSSTLLYLHCNWGWGGTSNGYFIQRSFYSSSASTNIYDSSNPDDASQTFNFDRLFSTVTVKK